MQHYVNVCQFGPLDILDLIEKPELFLNEIHHDGECSSLYMNGTFLFFNAIIHLLLIAENEVQREFH